MRHNADVVEIVEQYIHRRRLFVSGEKIIAAVSGGPDSLCLLLVLKEIGYRLHVAHFDHRMRRESRREAEWVARTAGQLGIPFSLGQGDVAAHAGQNRMTLEEAARDLRYAFLLQTARDRKAGVLATGHTKDDQAETVLMHIIRGTGIRGLAGIRPIRVIPGSGEKKTSIAIRIARPLLCLTHDQAREYCRQGGFTPVEDPSNQDTAFTRNKIRKELIPLLRKINPAVVEVLFRLADIAREQEDFLERETEKYWKRCAPPLTGGVVRMPRQVFIDSPAAVRQALIRRAVLDLTHTTKDLAYRHVDQVMEFLEHPTHSRRMDLALGVDVSMENDWIVFRRRSELADLPDWEGMAIPCPGRLLIRCPTWTITVSFPQSSTPTPSGKEPDPWTAWIDPERIRMPLYIRKRKTGEKFFPQGMPGPVSLSAFLSSHHMPFSERDLWPLVCDADGIIWIPGYRIKNGVSPVKETYRCMKIEVDPSC